MGEKYAFHLAPVGKEAIISSEGLEMNGGRIYLTNTRDNAFEWAGVIQEDHGIDSFVLFEVDLGGIEYFQTAGDAGYPVEIIVEEDIDASRLIKVDEFEM